MIERNKLNTGKTYEDIYGEEKANKIKEKMSVSRTGHIVSPETRKKISEKSTGVPRPTMVGDNNPAKRLEIREKIQQKALEREERKRHT